MIYLLIIIFVLVALLYLINVRENFSSCKFDNSVKSALNDVNRGLGVLNDVNRRLGRMSISPINLPCNL